MKETPRNQANQLSWVSEWRSSLIKIQKGLSRTFAMIEKGNYSKPAAAILIFFRI
jgi:hypothetical protein